MGLPTLLMILVWNVAQRIWIRIRRGLGLGFFGGKEEEIIVRVKINRSQNIYVSTAP